MISPRPASAPRPSSPQPAPTGHPLPTFPPASSKLQRRMKAAPFVLPSFLTAIHGRTGDRVYKTYRNGRVVETRVPSFEGYLPSAAQRAQRSRLRDATAYAHRVYALPAAKSLYTAAAQALHRQPFRLAIADYLAATRPASATSPKRSAPRDALARFNLCHALLTPAVPVTPSAAPAKPQLVAARPLPAPTTRPIDACPQRATVTPRPRPQSYSVRRHLPRRSPPARLRAPAATPAQSSIRLSAPSASPARRRANATAPPATLCRTAEARSAARAVAASTKRCRHTLDTSAR